MTEGAPDGRVWASRWYRITPRSFVHEELYFDPEEVVRVFAGESYKTFLLRRDGREERANELGEQYRDLSAARILESDDEHATIPVADVREIRLAAGTLLRKPKLVLATEERDREYYHYSRTHDVEPLATDLADLYPSIPVSVDGERV